jgi:hypothetical protein
MNLGLCSILDLLLQRRGVVEESPTLHNMNMDLQQQITHKEDPNISIPKKGARAKLALFSHEESTIKEDSHFCKIILENEPHFYYCLHCLFVWILYCINEGGEGTGDGMGYGRS